MLTCSVCGGSSFQRRAILWKRLIDEWQLSPREVDYIDRLQGECCSDCGANLRSIALADALRWCFRTDAPLSAFCASEAAAEIRMLELNEAGSLSPTLRKMPRHVAGSYPAVDMHDLPYPDGSFDVVTHSDTLEHVPNPLHALAECHRVLAKGGAVCFTVPIILARLSRSRDGLPPSYHGSADASTDDLIVRTEFGADAWVYPLQSGFANVHLFSVGFPAAIAMAAVKAQ